MASDSDKLKPVSFFIKKLTIFDISILKLYKFNISIQSFTTPKNTKFCMYSGIVGMWRIRNITNQRKSINPNLIFSSSLVDVSCSLITFSSSVEFCYDPLYKKHVNFVMFLMRERSITMPHHVGFRCPNLKIFMQKIWRMEK